MSADWLSKLVNRLEQSEKRILALEEQNEILHEQVNDLIGLSKDKRLWVEDDGNEVTKR